MSIGARPVLDSACRLIMSRVHKRKGGHAVGEKEEQGMHAANGCSIMSWPAWGYDSRHSSTAEGVTGDQLIA